MKKIFVIMVMLLGGYAAGMAQNDGDAPNDGGKIDALKIAYLTKKLNLSTEEAQKFWPVYNSYIKEIRTTRAEARRDKKKEIETDEKLLNIRKKYNGEFAKALSTEKVNAFFRAEKEFGVFLQKELMERRQQNLNNRRRLRQN